MVQNIQKMFGSDWLNDYTADTMPIKNKQGCENALPKTDPFLFLCLLKRLKVKPIAYLISKRIGKKYWK